MKSIRRLLVLFVVLAMAARASAAVPSTINYQGRLTDVAGIPQPGNRVMSLKVYDSVAAGVLLYSEILGNVPVDANGIYGFQFGANGNGASPVISSTLGGATQHWLEITVDGVVQQPRQKLQAVPFALVAKGLEDGSVSSAMIADGAIGLSKISGLGTAATANTTDFVNAANAALTGVPTAPTAALGTNTAQLATTAFVQANGGNPGGVFYAKSYGVRADGTTDDRLALQAAIDAAAAAATPSARATVILPAGKIMVSRGADVPGGIPNPGSRPYWKFCILLKNNVNVIGQGIDATTIQIITGTVEQTSGLFSDDVTGFSENITLKDFTMDSNATVRGVNSEGEGINIKTGKNLWIQGVRVKNAEQDGFDLDGGFDLTMVDCIAEDCGGCGLHLVSGGANKVLVSNSIFRRNGYVRRVQGGGGYAENGAGIDVSANDIVISNCLLENNAVEVQVLAGYVLMDGCVVTHTPSSLNLAALVAGWPYYPAITQGSFEIRNCKIYSNPAVPAIEVLQGFPNTIVSGSEVRGRIVCTSGANLIVNGNYINPGGGNSHGIHLVLASGVVTISDNVLENATNHIRVDSANNGKVLGNTFTNSVADLYFTGTTGVTDNWVVNGNVFNSTAVSRSIHIAAGSSGGTYSNNVGSNGGFSVGLGVGGSSTNNRFINNLISTLSVDSAASTGNLFERNVITGAITHPGATSFASNTWRGNTGAGCAGIFYGTVTLVNGTATVATPAANLARRFGFTRQSPNASTGIGHLALGAVTAQTSFVINALSSSAVVDTGDLSTVYWEILE